ncbi:class I SAM-dependent methyltransferase [Patescibacteria group bacterium]|nr:class I SAM-dependent methyltransferase [Patescibacteria group bacterium]
MKEKTAKKLLHQIKHTYDTIADEFSQSRNYIGREFSHFDLKGSGKIVDIGCGNGRFAGFLHLKGKYEYFGIDNNIKLLRIASAKYPKYKFIEGDQLKLPLKDGSADLAVNLRAFHHIPSEKLRLKALEEMRRILAEDGTLIISVWNLWQRKYIKQLATAIARWIFTFGDYDYNDTFIPWNGKNKRYYHAFTKRELKSIIKKAGLNIVKFYKVGKDMIIEAKKTNP